MDHLIDNRYRILESLGAGGMAEIFLAHDEDLGRRVALKVLSPYYAGDQEFVERFRGEARAAASLSHPNIVSIYDRGETEEGTYYIAMEYLPGGTLKERIVRKGALSPMRAAAVALQIAAALQAAHHQEVIHRDIKPHNILVTESGDVKVTDFGIARAAATSSRLTATGTVLGTAHYISPEQAMGESVGSESDLYSLGVILYEMVTGELPFEGDTTLGVAMKHVNAPVEPPAELNPEVPDKLNAVVVRLLAKYPGQRYWEAGELIRDLERIQEGFSPAGAATQAMVGRAAGEGSRGGSENSSSSQERAKGRLMPFLAGALVMVVVALLGWGGYTFLPALQAQNQPLRVPELTDAGLEGARKQAGEDFSINVSEEVESKKPVGTVLEQDPGADAQLEKGSQISVVVSGKQVAKVPDLTGKSVETARSTLSGEGFETKTQPRASSSSDKGEVMEQSPPGGEMAGAGSAVTLAVGDGPSTVEVPDLSGMSAVEAENALEQAGLQPGNRSTSPSEGVGEGSVISQNPAAGTGVEPGTSVGLTVSDGPPQITVPDVVGSDMEAARLAILEAGLDYSGRDVESQLPAGTVVSTSPTSGTEVDPGASVTLSESTNPPEPRPVAKDSEGGGDDGRDKDNAGDGPGSNGGGSTKGEKTSGGSSGSSKDNGGGENPGRVKSGGEGSQEKGGDGKEASVQKAVKAALKAHYRARGSGEFKKAYSYFGPAFRRKTDRGDWIAQQKSFDIESSTINSAEVVEVSGGKATAAIDVSFSDRTGNPRFALIWSVVKKDGEWKLNEELSSRRLSRP